MIQDREGGNIQVYQTKGWNSVSVVVYRRPLYVAFHVSCLYLPLYTWFTKFGTDMFSLCALFYDVNSFYRFCVQTSFFDSLREILRNSECGIGL